MKEMPRHDVLQTLSSPVLEEFRNPKARFADQVISKVSDLKGSCIVLSPCESGKVLLEVKEIELFLDHNGLLILGRLEGEVKWGNIGWKRITIDKMKRCRKEKLEKLKTFDSFYVGFPGSHYQFYIEKLRLRRLKVNGYKLIGITRLKAADLVSGLSIDDKVNLGDSIQCLKMLEWRCVNWACSSSCPWYSELPGGGHQEHCDCRDYGFCSYYLFAANLCINATRQCRSQGYWSLATRC